MHLYFFLSAGLHDLSLIRLELSEGRGWAPLLSSMALCARLEKSLCGQKQSWTHSTESRRPPRKRRRAFLPLRGSKAHGLDSTVLVGLPGPRLSAECLWVFPCWAGLASPRDLHSFPNGGAGAGLSVNYGCLTQIPKDVTLICERASEVEDVLS